MKKPARFRSLREPSGKKPGGQKGRETLRRAESPDIIVDHYPRRYGCTCSNCDTVTSASFPAEVTAPVQYGARICSFVVYLLNYYLDRLAELVPDLFGTGSGHHRPDERSL